MLHFTFCCLSASLFCCRMTDRYSSHCVWNSATCFLATSSSTVMASTFSRVSVILKRPLHSLFTWSPSSLLFSASSLTHRHTQRNHCVTATSPVYAVQDRREPSEDGVKTKKPTSYIQTPAPGSWWESHNYVSAAPTSSSGTPLLQTGA